MGVLGYILLVLFICIIVFLICRELNCWYFKINERRDLLSAIYNKLSSESSSGDSNETKEIIRLLNNINSKLSELSENTKKIENTQNTLNSEVDNSNNTSSSDSKTASSSSDEKRKEYSFIHSQGRLYVTKDSKLYCSHCYAFIESELFSSCPNCGKSLME